MSKSVFVTYILWLSLGWWGVHHFYLKRTRHAISWICTFGGFFCLGWVRDIWRIPEYVNDANQEQNYMRLLLVKMRQGKPEFNVTRFVGEIIMGYLFGFLGVSFLPGDIMEKRRTLIIIVPFFIAAGVHLVGNIGREGVAYKWALIGAFAMLVPLWNDHSALGLPALLSALAANAKGKDWDRSYRESSYIKNFFILVLCCSCYTMLWGSVLYHNAYVTASDGETIPLKEAIHHFLSSPVWREMKAKMYELWEFYKAHGYERTYTEFLKMADPEGEVYAHEVLGVKEGASEEEISNAYKSLVRIWHPDRVKDLKEKERANEKFLEIQKAYETLGKIKSRRKSAQKNI